MTEIDWDRNQIESTQLNAPIYGKSVSQQEQPPCALGLQ